MTEGWLIMPAYNEAEGIVANLEALSLFVAPYGERMEIRFTLLVVDDGSTDGTPQKVEGAREALTGRGVVLRLLTLVRNFGQQAALIAGLLEASRDADFAITLDADGEHPHSLVPSLIETWKRGALMVHTIRRPHQELGSFKRAASSAYYSVLAHVSGVRISPGMADFKLWDGALLREVSGFLPSCGSTRVFAAWLVPNAPAISYDQEIAAGRSSRFTLRQNLSFGLNGIIRYTELPLRLSLIMSAFAVLVGVTQTAFVIWASLTHRVVPGWSSMMIIVAFFGAMQSLSIGVLGEYLLRIQFRSGLPLFVANSRTARAEPQVSRGPDRTDSRPG